MFQDHACRSEGVELARELDYNAAAAWVGHPYFDVIDNSTEFEFKIKRMIEVCHFYFYGFKSLENKIDTEVIFKYFFKKKNCISINNIKSNFSGYSIIYFLVGN